MARTLLAKKEIDFSLKINDIEIFLLLPLDKLYTLIYEFFKVISLSFDFKKNTFFIIIIPSSNLLFT